MRGALPIFTVATSLISTGAPPAWPTSTFWIASGDWIRPMPRTIAACSPKLIVWPPTLPSLLDKAASTCATVTPWAFSRFWSITTS